ncbi:hypothetical protein ACIF70_40645 [Actinacidiphila glaucinigra]|uniref:hypothetical protein n=1 Tax=Actinacidiphila glaucinigra TaxID=235986 RepID=UPI0037C9701B
MTDTTSATALSRLPVPPGEDDDQAMLPQSGNGPAAQRGVFRVAPLDRETTWSLIGRIAARYRLDAAAVLGCWQWGNHRPRQRNCVTPVEDRHV